MIAKIIPRALRRLNIFRLASIITMPRVNFALVKEIKQQSIEKSDEERIYMQEQQSSDWTYNYDDVVSNYPFHAIPIGIIRNPSKFGLPEEQLNNLVAFKALKALKEDLLLAAKILFPNEDEKLFKQLDGRRVFSLHMEKHLQKYIKLLNNGEGTFKQRITAFIVLNHVYNDTLTIENVKKINSSAIINQDQSGVLLSFYVQLLIRYSLDYTQHLQQLLDKLEDSKTPKEASIQIAKAIFTTPNFSESYSRKIIDAAFAVIRNNIPSLHNYELLFIIRIVYQYKSNSSVIFAEAVQNYLIDRHINENNLDYHIPLILKTVRYCSKLGVSTNELMMFITNNMKRFQVIFDRKRISKGVFFSLLFSKTTKEVSPQLVQHLKKYFMDGLQNFITSKQSQENEILRFNKLLLKYFEYFSEKEQQYIQYQYIDKMIPYYASSTDVLFYSILIYLRVKKISQNKEFSQEELKQQQNVKKYIQLFFQRCCKKKSNEQLHARNHINQLIQMAYQIYRHNLNFNQKEMPHLCKYDFAEGQALKPQILNYFFYYLIKAQHEKKEHIKEALTSLEPLLEIYIRKDKLNSYKTILCIMDVCHRVSFEHNFFFKAIQNVLVNILIKNPKFVFLEKDLRFMNQKLIKRGYGSSGLKKLISQTLEKPRNWESHRRTYVENEKEFHEKIERKKRQQRKIRY